MRYYTLIITVSILNIMSNPLHAADQEQQHNLKSPPKQQKPSDWLADHFGLEPEPQLYGNFTEKELHYARALALASNDINYVARPIIKRPDRHAHNAMNEHQDLTMIRFNDMQVNKCAEPECSGPNYSVDPLYRSLARIGSTPSSYQTAISTKYRFQSDGSIKEEEIFNGCSHLFHDACLKQPGDACAFCGTIMPLTPHIEKKEPEQPAISHAAQYSFPTYALPNDITISEGSDYSGDITVPSEIVLDFNRSGEELNSEAAHFSDISSEEIEESELYYAMNNAEPASPSIPVDVDLAALAKRDCGICWDTMENAARKTTVTQCCSNMFHEECLNPCTACPYCKKKLLIAKLIAKEK